MMTLADALGFEWEGALIWPDTRQDYGKPRMVALGYIGLRLMVLVFVERPSWPRKSSRLPDFTYAPPP